MTFQTKLRAVTLATLFGLVSVASPTRSMAQDYRPVDANQVRYWFTHYLGQEPDRGTMRNYLLQMQNGASPVDLQARLLASDSFSRRFGTTPDDFVYGLYTTVLNREPAQWEIHGWAKHMYAGTRDRYATARDFILGAEPELRQKQVQRDFAQSQIVPVSPYYP